MKEEIIHLTDENFSKEVIEKSKKIPVIVDFWAPWCGPCQMLIPILEKIAKEYKGKIIIAKAETSENPKKCEEYDIMSIPSVKMFKNEKVISEFLGAIPEQQIKAWINQNL
ncbi:MAG: thioredoxin [Candidatus Pacearchaeota archaeon]